jgi:uncharacterized phiE125 gp8 family phage protein
MVPNGREDTPMLIELSSPAPDPAWVEDVVGQLRLPEGAAADPSTAALMSRLVDIARVRVERLTGHALGRRRVELRVASWREPVKVPLGPMVSLDAVATVDAAGLRSPLNAGDWRFGPVEAPSVVYVGPWPPPEPPPGGYGAATLTIGHGPDWRDAPAELREAVTLLAAQGFEDGAAGRDAAAALPRAVAALIEPYRRMRL